MNVYKSYDISTLLKDNEYAGRGIVIGTSPDRKNAVCAYFIMGRSENSRNRVFVEARYILPFQVIRVGKSRHDNRSEVHKAKRKGYSA